MKGRPHSARPRGQGGFTLLEVLVAVAILGLGLTAILSAQAGAFESAQHARNISVATGLLRCKMNEVEEHLYREGFQETDESGAGPCCEGDDNPNMKCIWKVERPQFPEARFGDLDLGAALNFGGASGMGGPGGSGGPGANPLGALGMLSGMGMPPGAAPGMSGGAMPTSMTDFAKTLADANQNAASGVPGMPDLSGSSSSGMSMSASSGMPGMPMDQAGAGAGGAMGGLASLAMSIVYPSLKLLFEASTRRITATLTFREGKKDYSIDVMEWFAVPQKGLAPTDDTTAADPTSPSTNPNKTTGGGVPRPPARQ